MADLHLNVFMIEDYLTRFRALKEEDPRDDPILKPAALIFLEEVNKILPDEKSGYAAMMIRSVSVQAVSDIAATGRLPAISSGALHAAYYGIIGCAIYVLEKKLAALTK